MAAHGAWRSPACASNPAADLASGTGMISWASSVSMQALDDPIAPAAAIPASALAANPHCILAVTPYGGHLGWIRGDNPLGPPWTDEPMLDFLQVAPSPLPDPAQLLAHVPGRTATLALVSHLAYTSALTLTDELFSSSSLADGDTSLQRGPTPSGCPCRPPSNCGQPSSCLKLIRLSRPQRVAISSSLRRPHCM